MDEDIIHTPSNNAAMSDTVSPKAVSPMKISGGGEDADSSSMTIDSIVPSSSNGNMSTSPAREVVTSNGSELRGCAALGGTASSIGDAGVVGEQFLQLAKSAKGAAAVQLIKEALAAPGLYVFAELLHMPNIKEVSTLYYNQSAQQ